MHQCERGNMYPEGENILKGKGEIITKINIHLALLHFTTSQDVGMCPEMSVPGSHTFAIKTSCGKIIRLESDHWSYLLVFLGPFQKLARKVIKPRLFFISPICIYCLLAILPKNLYFSTGALLIWFTSFFILISKEREHGKKGREEVKGEERRKCAKQNY